MSENSLIYVAIGAAIGFIIMRIGGYLEARKNHKECVYDPETKSWHKPF